MATIRGGERMEAALRELSKKVSKPGTLRVGFLEGATYPDGTSVPLVAAIQNFGAPSRGIPPRPFFSNMVAAEAESWGPALGKVLAAADYDVPLSLGRMGEHIRGQLQQSIRDTDSPPLAQSTIDRKGFDKPLVDTGHMLNSTDYEVTP